MANQLALALNREGLAEMSCIAGVGGGVPALVKTAQKATQIIALDGCPLHCVRHCLAKCNVQPTQHFTLTEFGLKKRQHSDYCADDFERIKNQVEQAIK
jgi:uncharacterized metal-binding protein